MKKLLLSFMEIFISLSVYSQETTSDVKGFVSDSSGNKILKNSISRDSFDSDINERNYFGPVSIQRLKISLVDYLGNLVNLNGHDWSFTLKVEELYEY